MARKPIGLSALIDNRHSTKPDTYHNGPAIGCLCTYVLGKYLTHLYLMYPLQLNDILNLPIVDVPEILSTFNGT